MAETKCVQEDIDEVGKKTAKVLFISFRTNLTIFGSSDMGRRFGADIGGTLAKLVYFEQLKNTEFMRRPRSLSHDAAALEVHDFIINQENYGKTGLRDVQLNVKSEKLGGTLHFLRFESKRVKSVVDTISHSGLNQSLRMLYCTGGGAHKFQDLFQSQAGIKIKKCDEIDCMIRGLNFLLNIDENEIYTFEDVDFKSLVATRVHRPRQNKEADIFPYLLVSIGSGVSIMNVRSATDFERVSGSSIGGGTYWGLCRMLTTCGTYDDALDMAENGDNFGVDMSVGDIYGGGYDRFKLPATTVASSFGKVVMKGPAKGQAEAREGTSEEDIARSLLIMVTQNIGQIAYLNACLYDTKRILFVGNFLRHNKISCRTLAYAIHFWSKGEMEAQFCEHEGYLGALGAFLYNAEFRREIHST